MDRRPTVSDAAQECANRQVDNLGRDHASGERIIILHTKRHTSVVYVTIYGEFLQVGRG
jgi:hypothetical protein